MLLRNYGWQKSFAIFPRCEGRSFTAFSLLEPLRSEAVVSPLWLCCDVSRNSQNFHQRNNNTIRSTLRAVCQDAFIKKVFLHNIHDWKVSLNWNRVKFGAVHVAFKLHLMVECCIWLDVVWVIALPFIFLYFESIWYFGLLSPFPS